MILSCPECSTAFHVEVLAINQGRKVRCGVCSNIWFASPNQLKEEPKKHIQPIRKNEKQKNLTSTLLKDKIELKKDFVPKPLVSKEIDRSNEYNEKNKNNKNTLFFSSVLNWLAFWLVFIVFTFSVGGFYGKNVIIGYYPETLKLYRLLNIQIVPNISKLEVLDLKAENKGDLIIISGKIFNRSFFPNISPVISVVTLNSEGKIIENFDIQGEQQVINAQDYNFFKTEIFLPEEKNLKIEEIRADLISEVPN